MSQDKVFFNILLVIIPLYFLQGWLFGHGSLISQTLAAIWLIIDIIYLIKYINLGQMESLGRVFLIFWLLQTITFIFTSISINNKGYSYGLLVLYSLFKNISIVFLSYFPFFIFTNKGVISDKKLKKFAILSLVCLIGAYFINYNEMVYNSESEDVANRGAYYLVVIIPLLGLFFDNILAFVLYGGIAVLALIGAKRGAIICVLIELLLFFHYYMKKSLQRKSSLKIIGILIVIGVLYFAIINIFERNEFLQVRYEETISGDSSDRDLIYSLALSKFIEQRPIHQLFGNGMSSTLNIIDGYAHQDWLELLINNGLLGVIVYAMIFVTLFLYFRKKNKQLSVMEKFMFLSSTIGWLMRSMFSMGYVSIETSFYVIVFGLICANQRKQLPKKIF